MAEHIIGPVSDFPSGSHRVVQLGRVAVGIFNVDGQFHALLNICPHQFGPLCEGTVNGTTACSAETDWQFAWVRQGEIVTCPWHGIEFDIASGKSLSSPKLMVRTYQVVVEDGLVKLTV
jgi:nitrite reductase (NADH) small subunit